MVAVLLLAGLTLLFPPAAAKNVVDPGPQWWPLQGHEWSSRDRTLSEYNIIGSSDVDVEGRKVKVLMHQMPTPVRELAVERFGSKGCEKEPCYPWAEAHNPDGPHTCTSDCQCEGLRRCSKTGFCDGDVGYCAARDNADAILEAGMAEMLSEQNAIPLADRAMPSIAPHPGLPMPKGDGFSGQSSQDTMPSASSCTKNEVHVVQPHDSYVSIAKTYAATFGFSLDLLKEANRYVELEPGKTVIIPCRALKVGPPGLVQGQKDKKKHGNADNFAMPGADDSIEETHGYGEMEQLAGPAQRSTTNMEGLFKDPDNRLAIGEIGAPGKRNKCTKAELSEYCRKDLNVTGSAVTGNTNCNNTLCGCCMPTPTPTPTPSPSPLPWCEHRSVFKGHGKCSAIDPMSVLLIRPSPSPLPSPTTDSVEEEAGASPSPLASPNASPATTTASTTTTTSKCTNETLPWDSAMGEADPIVYDTPQGYDPNAKDGWVFSNRSDPLGTKLFSRSKLFERNAIASPSPEPSPEDDGKVHLHGQNLELCGLKCCRTENCTYFSFAAPNHCILHETCQYLDTDCADCDMYDTHRLLKGVPEEGMPPAIPSPDPFKPILPDGAYDGPIVLSQFDN